MSYFNICENLFSLGKIRALFFKLSVLENINSFGIRCSSLEKLSGRIEIPVMFLLPLLWYLDMLVTQGTLFYCEIWFWMPLISSCLRTEAVYFRKLFKPPVKPLQRVKLEMIYTAKARIFWKNKHPYLMLALLTCYLLLRGLTLSDIF